jgi:hypothetical protein
LTLCVDWNFIYGKFGSESEESEVENRHEVLYDEPRGYPRLTCISDECNHETLVRQPYMSDERYLQEVAEFLEKHKGGELYMQMIYRAKLELCAKKDQRYEIFLRQN